MQEEMRPNEQSFEDEGCPEGFPASRIGTRAKPRKDRISHAQGYLKHEGTCPSNQSPDSPSSTGATIAGPFV